MKLVFYSSGCCIRKAPKGAVRRYPHRGKLYGYYVACPECGYIALHGQGQADGALFKETGESEKRPATGCGGCVASRCQSEAFRVEALEAEGIRCVACRRIITIAAGEIVARVAGAA